MANLYRAQILLEPEQHRRLSQLAEAEERSMSDLVREIVAEYLVERGRSAQRERELDALDALDRLRRDIPPAAELEKLLETAREERVYELTNGWQEKP